MIPMMKLNTNLPDCGKSVELVKRPLMFRYWGIVAKAIVENRRIAPSEMKTTEKRRGRGMDCDKYDMVFITSSSSCP